MSEVQAIVANKNGCNAVGLLCDKGTYLYEKLMTENVVDITGFDKSIKENPAWKLIVAEAECNIEFAFAQPLWVRAIGVISMQTYMSANVNALSKTITE